MAALVGLGLSLETPTHSPTIILLFLLYPLKHKFSEFRQTNTLAEQDKTNVKIVHWDNINSGLVGIIIWIRWYEMVVFRVPIAT